MFKRKFVRQENLRDCAAACLLMVIRHYKGNYPLEQLRIMMKTDKNGTSAFNLIEAAKRVGFNAKGYQCSDYRYIKCPSIAHVIIDKSYHHFVVIKSIDYMNKTITIADPAFGIKKYLFTEFDQIWSKTVISLYPFRKIKNINATHNIIKTIYQLIKPHTTIFIATLLLSIIYTVFSIISTIYFKIIIDNNILSINRHVHIFIFFVIVMIIRLVIDFIRNKLLIYINKEIDNSLMNNTIKHLLSLPWHYFNSRTTGDIIARINDLGYVRDLISKSSIIVLVDLVLVIGSLIAMAHINYSLFAITILFFTLYLIIVYIFSKPIRIFITRNQEANASVSSSLVETVMGINTIKNLGIENQIYNKVLNKYNELVDNIYIFNKKYNLIKMIKDFINNFGLLFVMLLGSIFITNGSLSIGDFIIFNFFLTFFLEPMKNIFEVEPLLRESANALVRISEFYDIEVDKQDKGNKIEYGNVAINNLSHSYNGLDNVIDEVSFNIAKGEKIMINGSSGSGKSTIARMLMKHLDIGDNQIIIDGVDVNNYSFKEIRDNICYVSQQEMIFTDSLYNNIDLYRDYSKKEIDNVINITKVNEIIEKHKEDTYMLLEENGANLSGGERQRLLIARALLKKSKVFILDESLSEMNLSLERSIIQDIFKGYPDKTFIVISHRLDNADLYDRVITLDKKEERGVIL